MKGKLSKIIKEVFEMKKEEREKFKQEAINKYVNENLSMNKIAKELGISDSTVKKFLQEERIEIKKIRLNYTVKENLFECIKTCAEYYGINYGTMRGWLSGEGHIPKYFKEHNLHYI